MSGTGPLEAFIVWGQEAAAGLGSRGEFTVCPPTDNTAARLDLDGDGVLARITLWADGSYHAEAIDSDTSSTLLSRFGQAVPGCGFATEFADVLSLVGIG